MADLDFPTIGDILLSPHTKVLDPQGNYKYDLLECDGSEVDSEVYPELSEVISVTLFQSTGAQFPVTEDSRPLGICRVGDYFWVLGSFSGYARQYTEDFVATGVSFNAGVNSVQSICTNSRGFWVAEQNGGNIRNYSTEGVATGLVFSTSSELTYIMGVCATDEFFWVMDQAGNVAKYDYDGVYTGVIFQVAVETSNAIEYIDGKLLIVNTDSLIVCTTSGDIISEVSTSDYSDNSLQGVLFYNELLYLVNKADKTVEVFSPSPTTMPSLTSPSTTIPYKIVADLTE